MTLSNKSIESESVGDKPIRACRASASVNATTEEETQPMPRLSRGDQTAPRQQDVAIMESVTTKPSGSEKARTYVFRVVLEQDYDVDGHSDGWHVYATDLKAASTWGETQDQALRHIREVIEMTLEGMLDRGEEIPVKPLEEGQTIQDITVTV